MTATASIRRMFGLLLLFIFLPLAALAGSTVELQQGGVFRFIRDEGSGADCLAVDISGVSGGLAGNKLTVSGPGGFGYTFTERDLIPSREGNQELRRVFPSEASLPAGIYTFTLENEAGQTSHRIATHGSGEGLLQKVDRTTINHQRTATGSYRVSWAPIIDHQPHYYRLRLEQTDTGGETTFLGTWDATPFQELPPGTMIDGNRYTVQVETGDAPYMSLLTGLSQSDSVELTPLPTDFNPARLIIDAPHALALVDDHGVRTTTFGFCVASRDSAAAISEIMLFGPTGQSITFPPHDLQEPGGTCFVTTVATPAVPGIYKFRIVAHGILHHAYATLQEPDILPSTLSETCLSALECHGSSSTRSTSKPLDAPSPGVTATRIKAAAVTVTITTNPPAKPLNYKGAKGTIRFTAPLDTTLDTLKTAITSDAFITVDPTLLKFNNGKGSLPYLVAANATTDMRSGVITIGSATFPITQNGVPCKIVSITITPTTALPAEGGSISVNINVEPNTCGWKVSTYKIAPDIWFSANGTFPPVDMLQNGDQTLTGTVAQNSSGKAQSNVISLVTADGKSKKRISLKQAKATLHSISGTVATATAGLAGVTLTLGGSSAATASTTTNGKYVFNSLANGIYTLTPSKAGFTFTPASNQVTVNGQNIVGVNFTGVSTQGAVIVPCPASGTSKVSIKDFSFNPANVTIPAGGIVMWTNSGAVTHTVTSGTSPVGDGDFASGGLSPGGKICMQFPVAGTFPYFCSIHTFMTGTVTVQ